MNERLESPPMAADLSHLVAQASRFFNGLARLKVFQTGEIDLTEWVILTQVSHFDRITINGLAKTLGITKTQALAIVTSLEHRNLLTIYDSDGAKRLMITSDGIERCAEVNTQIEPVIEAVIGSKRQLLRGVSDFFVLLIKNTSDQT